MSNNQKQEILDNALETIGEYKTRLTAIGIQLRNIDPPISEDTTHSDSFTTEDVADFLEAACNNLDDAYENLDLIICANQE